MYHLITGKHKQQSNKEDTEEDDGQRNVLVQSTASKCDNNYDDDDSLLVVVKEEQKTTSEDKQTKTLSVSDDAQDGTGGGIVTDTKACRDSGPILSDKLNASMETEIMDNSYSSEASSICINPSTMAIDSNHYDPGINCQLVQLNDVQLMDSMLSELSLSGENNGDIDAQLLPEGNMLSLG